MMKTLFLHPPSFDGYDGGAGARYQMKREVRSFWYPTWLAQPAALVEGSKLIDAPPHRLSFDDIASDVRSQFGQDSSYSSSCRCISGSPISHAGQTAGATTCDGNRLSKWLNVATMYVFSNAVAREPLG